ncbi:MAG: hypothetical protein KDD62_04610 [Bdellovibrionales bacterium]|nr:hypothetical protein [Bdellovibrionales bacterium]
MTNSIVWQPENFELPITTPDVSEEIFMPYSKVTLLAFCLWHDTTLALVFSDITLRRFQC